MMFLANIRLKTFASSSRKPPQISTAPRRDKSNPDIRAIRVWLLCGFCGAFYHDLYTALPVPSTGDLKPL